MAEQSARSAAEMSRAEMAARETGAVVVDIYDQIYQLRGTDPQHIERLAAIVDAKMRAVSAHGATVDSLRVAVLAALNIADELMTPAGTLRLAGWQSESGTEQRAKPHRLAGGHAGRGSGRAQGRLVTVRKLAAGARQAQKRFVSTKNTRGVAQGGNEGTPAWATIAPALLFSRPTVSEVSAWKRWRSETIRLCPWTRLRRG